MAWEQEVQNKAKKSIDFNKSRLGEPNASLSSSGRIAIVDTESELAGTPLEELFGPNAKRQANANPQLALAITAHIGANVVAGRPHSDVVRKMEIHSASPAHGEARFAAR